MLDYCRVLISIESSLKTCFLFTTIQWSLQPGHRVSWSDVVCGFSPYQTYVKSMISIPESHWNGLNLKYKHVLNMFEHIKTSSVMFEIPMLFFYKAIRGINLSTHLSPASMMYAGPLFLSSKTSCMWKDLHFCWTFGFGVVTFPKKTCCHWIGLRENLNRKPWFLPSNMTGFPVNVPIIQFYDVGVFQ